MTEDQIKHEAEVKSQQEMAERDRLYGDEIVELAAADQLVLDEIKRNS